MRNELVDGIAASGDAGRVWLEVNRLVHSWAVHFRKNCNPATIDHDDLVGEASLKFMTVMRTWDHNRPFLPYLKACVYRHWLLLSKRSVQKLISSKLEKIPADRRAKFGLPGGIDCESEFNDGGSNGGPLMGCRGKIGVWTDKAASDDEILCEDILAALNKGDAAVLREYMNQDGLRAKPGFVGSIRRARNILGATVAPVGPQ